MLTAVKAHLWGKVQLLESHEPGGYAAEQTRQGHLTITGGVSGVSTIRLWVEGEAPAIDSEIALLRRGAPPPPRGFTLQARGDDSGSDGIDRRIQKKSSVYWGGGRVYGPYGPAAANTGLR